MPTVILTPGATCPLVRSSISPRALSSTRLLIPAFWPLIRRTLALLLAAALALPPSESNASQTNTIKPTSGDVSPKLSAEELKEFELIENTDVEGFLEATTSITELGEMKLLAREAPSTVSVITAEDIRINHCRDLVDVLLMVPGFGINQDLSDTSMSLRGLYAFWGKILFMVDGMMLNGMRLGRYNIGNDFPIHLIDRIEIVRSPGFLVFGANAELGVVNIVTKKGSQLQGGRFSTRYGHLTRYFSQRNIGGTFGKKTGDVEYSLLAYMGDAMRSDGDFTQGRYGPTVPHRIDTIFAADRDFVFKGTFKEDLSLNLFYHYYSFFDMETFSYDPSVDGDLELIRKSSGASHFNDSHGGDISKKWKFNSNLSFNTYLSYVWNGEVIHNEPAFEGGSSQPRVEKTRGGTLGKLSYNNIDIAFGGEYYRDRIFMMMDGRDPNKGLRKIPSDPLRQDITVDGYVGFGSIAYRIRPTLFSGLGPQASRGSIYLFSGFRAEWNELFGDVIVPRFGVTWVNGPVHGKLIHSVTYRPPSLGQNALNTFGMDSSKPWRPTRVTPERGSVTEMEWGYRFSSSLNGSINLFYNKLENMIEFKTPLYSDYYTQNGGTLGTWGAETEWNLIFRRYRGLLNISYHKLAEAGSDTYLTPSNNKVLLSQPDFKVYTNSSWNLNSHWSAQGNLLFVSKRSAQYYDVSGSDPTMYEGWEPAQIITGVGLLWRRPTEDIDLEFSIHDLFNQRLRLVSGQRDGADPLQYKGREVSVKFNYRL